MGDKTKIEWTDATWNPVRGCSVVSEGCRNCYAMQVAARFSDAGQAYEGLAYRNESGAHWTGSVRVVEEHLHDPLKWQRPRRIFVNSMSDLFHDAVPDQAITDIFGIMALAHWHTFQILTKRPQRMRAYLAAGDHGIIQQFTAIQQGGGIAPQLVFRALDAKRRAGLGWSWPLPNVWLGVSVEHQQTADERIPLLLETPAAVRWLSAEPLLGPINLNLAKCLNGHGWVTPVRVNNDKDWGCPTCGAYVNGLYTGFHKKRPIDWVVVGGESGKNARPMQSAWARSLRDQCAAAGVPFFFKQWGEHIPLDQGAAAGLNLSMTDALNANTLGGGFIRIGKKKAGRVLDGREWNEMPEVALV